MHETTSVTLFVILTGLLEREITVNDSKTKPVRAAGEEETVNVNVSNALKQSLNYYIATQ